MENLKIDEKEAIKEFPRAPQWFQKVLINTFGAETFSGISFERLSTFGDAYVWADDATRKEFDDSPGGTPDEIAYKKLKLITRVANTDPVTGKTWTPDWKNTDQKKWFPIFNLSSGCGFADSTYDYDYSDTSVGSRLCFETKEKSDFIAKQFIKLYTDYLTR